MDKGKLTNLIKETEKGLFRANKHLKAVDKLALEIGLLLQNLAVAEESSKRTPALAAELRKQMRENQVVGQSNELFALLEKLRRELNTLSESEERARRFVEMHRTKRVYAFADGKATVRFARQFLELFSLNNVLFRPRFIGTIDLSELANKLRLRKEGNGLLLQPKDLRPFVKHLSDKRFASNISLEAGGIRLVWQDRKSIVVEASVEKLYRLDRLCEALQGKCLEK